MFLTFDIWFFGAFVFDWKEAVEMYWKQWRGRRCSKRPSRMVAAPCATCSPVSGKAPVISESGFSLWNVIHNSALQRLKGFKLHMIWSFTSEDVCHWTSLMLSFCIDDIVLFFLFVVRITLQLCKCYINSYTNIIVVTIIAIINNVFFVVFLYRCRKDHASPHQTPDQELENLQAGKMKTPVQSSSFLYIKRCLSSVPHVFSQSWTLWLGH